MRGVRTAAVLIWLPVVVIVATWAAWSDRLPERMGTHWNGFGAPDRYSSATWFGVTLLVIAVAAGVAGVFVAGRSRLLTGVAGAVTGGTAGIWLSTAEAALSDGRLGWRFVYFVAGLGWGALVAAVAGPSASPVRPAPQGVDPLDLAPTERAAFSTTLRAPLIMAVTLVAALPIAVFAALAQPVLWPVLAVVLAAGLMFGRIRVTADTRGLRVVAGLIGVPVKRIPLSDITGVEVADINPLEWGGWGYRVIPGRTALVLRAGPGLVLHLRGGRRFAVTMDDPRTPAALLTALQARATG
ncbi:DUF1648 domain-containing protein [Paractinoplanes rishiriensis]|uniref:DUF1648 domain-containing protein n=1 Tax=Paractinoplanes rishiriensis TaxID=1050105 RepID=A0A919K6A5_9ACTN|nr:DUF1648 domain-containing protein [Actinoplanes rishiriensis]GIE99700.1 hypothetical protein Ari01nite_71650 [Actinoplanes rishiriensis]